MRIQNKERDEQPLLRIGTKKKYSAIPIKDAKEESMFIVTTAKKSSVRAKIKCEGCGALTSPYDIRKCNGCGNDYCINCLKTKKDKYYCSECL